jgi:hypothetical protein
LQEKEYWHADEERLVFGFVFKENHGAKRSESAGEESQCQENELRHSPLGENGAVFVPAINSEGQNTHDVYDEKVVHNYRRFIDKDNLWDEILSHYSI